MKKTNKGFSLVELIIVIAIMAILAGALAPALIKYINKSRLSTDVQTGNAIATGMQAALANEDAYDDACDHFTKSSGNDTIADFYATNVGEFGKQVQSAVGKQPVGKAKKDAGGGSLDDKFYYTMDPIKNSISIFRKTGADEDFEVFPSVGKSMSK